MLRRLSKWMGIANASKPPFDPAVFNDTLALQVNWAPLCRGGTNFRTRRLVQPDLNRAEFRATPGAMLFGAVFGILGLAAFGAGIMVLWPKPGSEMPEWGGLLPLLVGLVFIAAGVWMIRSFSVPIVFDRQHGFFWKGRQAPMEVVNRAEIKCCSPLADIHALQLISEFCRSDKSSYYSYELNLVLRSGERINVFDHGHLETARADAQQLAEFLGRPLWDAILR